MNGIRTVPAGCTYVGSRDELSESQRTLAEALAFACGETYDAYLLLEEGRQYFFSNDGRGVVGFTTWGRHAFVLGGLLAHPDDKPELLQQFLEFARGNRLSPKFFSILESDRDLFRSHGFLVSKTGEEPVIDLRDQEWRGKRYEWVRRQENYCVRNGVRCREVVLEDLSENQRRASIAELMRISDEHVAATAFGRELSVTVGKVDFDQMHRRRLFVAEQDGRPVAFVVANPAYDGDMWVVEMYRKAADSPRGVIAFLIVQISRQLREEGVPFLSLCQVPSLRAASSTTTQSALVRCSMGIWWKYVPWLYDPERQYHFKSRFRPAYRECLVAAPAGFQLLPFIAFALQWGVVWPDFRRLPAHMWSRIRKWSHAEQLADPEAEEHTVLGDLGPLIAAHRGEFPESAGRPLPAWPSEAAAQVSRGGVFAESIRTASTTSRESITSAS